MTMLARERQYSAHTLRGYQHELTQLATLAAGRLLSTLSAIDIRGAVSRAHAGGMHPRSIAHRLSVWRGFYKWRALDGDLKTNPVDGIRAPKQARTLPKALSADDAARLMQAVPAPARRHRDGADSDIGADAEDETIASAAPSKPASASAVAASADGQPLPSTEDPVTQARDRAMLELLYSSGLRLAELISLDHHYMERKDYRSISWLDLPQAEVIVTGKGGKRRGVPVGRKAMDALRDWMTIRGQWIKDDSDALFLSARGQRVSPTLVRRVVKAVALRAGIPTNVHPHVLRHSFATHLLQSSGDLRAVQEMLGHASIAATQVYTSLDFQYLAKIYDAAHPRARKKPD
ncbi:tyrosine recombinase XerC [Robbsia sp. KACC 23696]|uniref:tyrosine recombinase XerC n=1 Tax=Robbsia sp. KACC 23696 TaxID=3149231 RepID=UPI00325AD896